ncbi:MAG: molybdopterin molybdotransferase MoeA [Oscillospiraceae bacterium]|nr:molybdopterin molybdotransferase MoeA [Oscillospiraceae bacterium]
MKSDFSNHIPKQTALDRLFAKWKPTPETVTVPVGDCAGRVLAEDTFAKYDLPVVRASAMDGIAVHSALFADGLPDTSGWRLGVDYIRADTGDDFDDAYDAVIPIENVTVLPEGGIALDPDTEVRPGSNVRPCGSTVRKDTPLVKAGTRLSPLDMTAIAMGGYGEVKVLRRPRVAFIPSGSELVPVGSELKRGQNFDTNSLLIRELLVRMGAEPIMHPIVKDDPAALRQAVEELLPRCDILLLGAGTSKGGEDYGTGIIAEFGEPLFHGVAAVPGRPMSMAVGGGKALVNLSGPTFAAFYSMEWAVRAMVCHFLGQKLYQRTKIRARLTEDLRTPPMFSSLNAFHVTRDGEGYLATLAALRGPNSRGQAAVLTADAIYASVPGEKPRRAGEEIELELLRNAAQLQSE